ncbi:MAG TPA: ubiquinol-cytochrome c reductase iron-sulfur subunit [Trebonia sp.]|jgi:ubiquinol-cytochrome c reductase iron-sulfur subunit|nr:ubiquinol-cytochrome c reductase iron-sulfur subunit [Trebonia sp.]
MSDEVAEPRGSHRKVGTPPPTPYAVDTETEEPPTPTEAGYSLDPDNPVHAKRAEKLVAALFVLAFLAGCGFIAAYVGLEVGTSAIPKGANNVIAVLRSNLALGTSMSVVLLALGTGSMIWVRHLTPDIEIEEERHELRSQAEDRKEFQREFAEGAAISQVTKRPLLRRTLLLATAPLAIAPLFLLRDLGPLPGTSLRHTVWRKGLRAVTYGSQHPLRPADIATPGSLITVIPEGYEDDQNALAKAGVILIKFEDGQLDVPTVYNGKVQLYGMNWTVDNIVAYSKICTHVGCPVALYEQTSHHILCPCHQSTFDAAHGADVVFGPAARPLPQLPLGTDADGYLVALSDFTQPVGPSFWERG